jgi:hypothetical protein
MQYDAPIRFCLNRQAQTRAARRQRRLADGATHVDASSILPTFCLLSVTGFPRISEDTLSVNH